MYKVDKTKTNRDRTKLRLRSSISGTSKRPRLTVFRSNKYIQAQLIDDVKGVTLLSVSTAKNDAYKGKTKVEASFEAGKDLAKKAVEKKIKEAVFDRNGYIYHGRVKSLAEGAREGGLAF